MKSYQNKNQGQVVKMKWSKVVACGQNEKWLQVVKMKVRRSGQNDKWIKLKKIYNWEWKTLKAVKLSGQN